MSGVTGGVVELPVLGEPTCPAAMKIAGAMGSQQGVVCREYERAAQNDPGLRMTPRALEVLRESTGGKYLNLKSDPSTVTAFCHGDATPVLTNGDGQGRASYTYCPVWQAARDAFLAGRDGLVEEQEPESVSSPEYDEMMRSTLDAPDPWAAARWALDELDPDHAGMT